LQLTEGEVIGLVTNTITLKSKYTPVSYTGFQVHCPDQI